MQKLSKPAGEWHIIDSPFYASEALVAAKERSANYYSEKDIPEMNNYYFHHSESEVQQLGGTVLYQPKKRIGRLLNRVGFLHNPFPWIRIPL